MAKGFANALAALVLTGPTSVVCGAGSGPDCLWPFLEGEGTSTRVVLRRGVVEVSIHGAEWTDGVAGNALRFAGASAHVPCAGIPDLNVGTGDFSVATWIRSSSARTNDTILGKRGTNGAPHWSVFIENGRVRAYINRGGDWRRADWAVGGTHVVDGAWHHVVAVFARSVGVICVYVDGRRDGSEAIERIAGSVSLDNDGQFTIGAQPGGRNSFPGDIGETRFWRRALATDEAAQLSARSSDSQAEPLARKLETTMDQASRAGPSEERGTLRFGTTADAHFRMNSGAGPAQIRSFVQDMLAWKPDFVVDLGDLAIQMKEGQTTAEMHEWQLRNLDQACTLLEALECPRYYVMGNHCVGWLKGGDDVISPGDLIRGWHSGEDITKLQYVSRTRMPHRYYAVHLPDHVLIMLDGNSARGPNAVPEAHDGVPGAYWIDDTQKAWLAALLAATRGKRKLVFCHEELHHTPGQGSGEGGDVPFPAVGKERSYVDNGWELRTLFADDNQVVACFFGHRHRSRWVVYGGVHYITLAALHWGTSYAKVTLSAEALLLEGAGNQRSLRLPLDSAGAE